MSDEPDLKSRIEEAVAFLRTRTDREPEVGLVLGSGLGKLAERIEDRVDVPFTEIPHFPESTVKGHAGQLRIGTLEGKAVVAMQGRYHLYEGLAPPQVTFPIRVLKALGIRVLVLTNAGGGINRHFRRGDLMVIDDHINWMHHNPLIGPNDEDLGPRFPALSEAYTPRLVELAQEVGHELGVRVQQGILLAVHGPSYETPAALRLYDRLGADAVGMSVIPEAIVAQHAGVSEVLGITCITDMATGEATEPLTHDEVLAGALQAEKSFTRLLEGVMKRL